MSFISCVAEETEDALLLSQVMALAKAAQGSYDSNDIKTAYDLVKYIYDMFDREF